MTQLVNQQMTQVTTYATNKEPMWVAEDGWGQFVDLELGMEIETRPNSLCDTKKKIVDVEGGWVDKRWMDVDGGWMDTRWMDEGWMFENSVNNKINMNTGQSAMGGVGIFTIYMFRVCDWLLRE